MNDESIKQRISDLIDREHQLRRQREDGSLDAETEHHELVSAEVELDQCWDLLRQRRARRVAGQDPDEASPRSGAVVEGYWQ